MGFVVRPPRAAELSPFRLMADQDLRDAAARLEATVRELARAQGEVGLRIQFAYSEALDAARKELARRQAA